MTYVLGSMDAARNADFHSSQALTAILWTLALRHGFGVSGFSLDKPAEIVLVRLLPSVIAGPTGTRRGRRVGFCAAGWSFRLAVSSRFQIKKLIGQ